MSDMAPADGGQGASPSVAPVSPTNTGAITEQNNGSPGQLSNGFEWLNGADELTVGYAQNKGWDSPLKALDSYRNLEKLLGADKANNAVIVPKADADPKDWGNLYDRLGRPTGPDGYKFEAANGDQNFTKALSEKFHELGLSKNQGEQFAGWFNEMMTKGQEGEASATAAKSEAEYQELRNEWGAAYDKNVLIAREGAAQLGMSKEAIDKIEGAIGTKATMELFQKYGALVPEDRLVTGASNAGFGSTMTPAAAKAQIQSLMQDKEFVAKYVGKNSDAVTKMAQLHAYAYPGQN
jgi:hypothetical protein